jgi:hypothetical protein
MCSLSITDYRLLLFVSTDYCTVFKVKENPSLGIRSGYPLPDLHIEGIEAQEKVEGIMQRFA